MPTVNQKFAAAVRAFYEKKLKKTERPVKGFKGCFEIDPEKAKKKTAAKFGLKLRDIPFFLSYARYCDHPWDQGACNKCPPADHLPVPQDWNPTMEELYGKP